jgi:hypothetical protein
MIEAKPENLIGDPMTATRSTRNYDERVRG